MDNLWMLPALMPPEAPFDLHRCRLGPAIGEHVLTNVDRVKCAGHVDEVEGRGAEQGV
ncbi:MULTISPECIES: hypothetical protein [Prauserella salsuginis group]|uniref:Uncharacterized protein n=2 Tax=Prauserella salsuginis group TaxID=2893672 RepID=A0A839XLL7_9PSEU|nr:MULTISPECIES: hypothetical protein [Prauserella salsuginis group]MBB3662719.1 hypothetical protein [Prauserella sediminis]